MGTRKTTFEVVPLAEIAPLLGNADVLGETPEAEGETARKPAKILSVSYDHSLAATREMLFASVGLQVSSVLNVDLAIKLCASERFDLIVIGHSLPLSHRQSLFKELRHRCNAPILALHRQGEPPLTGATYIFDSTLSPALLLEMVTNILKLNSGPDAGVRASN